MTQPRILKGPVEAGLWRMAEEIFFLSAAPQDFDDTGKKQAFLERWTGYYRDCEPQHIYVAVLPDGHAAGYLTGCIDSRAAERLYRDIPYYSLFEDQFGEYPAHLHVNVAPQWRSRGVGSRLVAAFIDDCDAARLAGVHIVTVAGLPNVRFYNTCGFATAVKRPWGQSELLFLGKSLRRP